MNGSQLPMLIFLMLCQRKLNKPDVHPWTVCIDWRIMFSNYFQPLSQKVSIKDQFPGVEDRYNIYFTKGIYFCFYCGRSCYLYILQDVCFYFTRKKVYCCYSYNSVKVLEFCQNSWKFLEFESIFLMGTMEYQIHTKLVWITFAGIDTLHLWEELHYWA